MPEGSMFMERRRYPRVTVEIPVKYRLIDDQKELATVFDRKKKDTHTRSLDLSLGGIYITADQRLKVGTILRLEITVPEPSTLLSAFAEVIWSNDTGGGLHFLAMKDEDMECLKGYIEKMNS
jgi:c-di-GMP-binding flagellar brake protein YcgR